MILGAGPAGIGAGLALGDEAIVLESGHDPGGLSRTIELEGAVFDLGGHSFHTPHRAIRDLVFGAVEMFEQTRDARCFFRGAMIPFPFQRNYDQLGDPVIKAECADGLSKAADGQAATHFGEYLTQRFGPGIAGHFLLPYNRKLWGSDLSRLDTDWVDQRVTAPGDGRPEPVRTPGKREPLQADTTVAYPARGGFGEIFRSLARRLPDLRVNTRAVHIDASTREVLTADGCRLRYEQIVSTMPIPRLLALVDSVPREIHEAAARLQALPLDIVLVVVGHPVDTPVQRVYCADPDIPGHKIALNHNSSNHLRSLPHHGIAVEVSRTSLNRWPGEDELTRRVVAGLKVMGLIRSPSDIVASRIVSIPAAYPVPTLGRCASVRKILTWLAYLGVHSVGRFDEWAYINSDEALDRGLRLGESLARRNEPGVALEPPHNHHFQGSTPCVRI